jgi:hypothetical protein
MHPFQLIPVRFRRFLIYPLLLFTSALGLYLLYRNSELSTGAAPLGLVNLELARSPEQVSAILKSWEEKRPALPQPRTIQEAIQQVPRGATDTAEAILWQSFFFLFGYALTLSMASAWLAERDNAPRFGVLCAWLTPIGGTCDALENLLLMQTMNLRAPDAALIARTFPVAVAKFVILGFVVGWVVLALIRTKR